VRQNGEPNNRHHPKLNNDSELSGTSRSTVAPARESGVGAAGAASAPALDLELLALL
jgi:hypothetical protein